jgi:hypothetical protein
MILALFLSFSFNGCVDAALMGVAEVGLINTIEGTEKYKNERATDQTSSTVRKVKQFFGIGIYGTPEYKEAYERRMAEIEAEKEEEKLTAQNQE